jgi:hypothetical protein
MCHKKIEENTEGNVRELHNEKHNFLPPDIFTAMKSWKMS